MQVEDIAGKKSRWEATTSALEDVHPALRALRELFEVKLYTFAGETSPIDIDKPRFDFGSGAVGQQTAVKRSVGRCLRAPRGWQAIGRRRATERWGAARVAAA